MLHLIRNATIVNESERFVGSVLINGNFIEEIWRGSDVPPIQKRYAETDATGLLLLPGAIDDQVHFREPGLTHKANIYSESRSAVAGGVTSFMEMPNTKPQTTTIDLLEEKYAIAAQNSFANYSFYMGATNDNIDELKKVDARKVCGIKVFMGSSTGNMLVDDEKTLSRIFSEIPMLIATHCEDELTIRGNIDFYKNQLGEDIPIAYHPLIRSEEACYKSSSKAVELAKKYASRLHILHISTAKELSLFDNTTDINRKKITSEACVHHLWFSEKDYRFFGNKIKWNPAVKTLNDRETIINAVNDNRIDVVATDHAPHLWSEKEGNCLTAASGGPLVQHSLVAMLQLAKEGKFTIEKVVEKMSHAPAELFRINKRGFIRKGYFADLVLVNPNDAWTVDKSNILSQCAWSPFEGVTFHNKVIKTWVNGTIAYDNGQITEQSRGQRLDFNY